jgi:menaquinone-dependent protoporphyrinogen IX oxidase
MSGQAPGWRQAPVWMLAGRMNAPRWSWRDDVMFVVLLREVVMWVLTQKNEIGVVMEPLDQ